MQSERRQILVAGATGGIGRAVLERARAAGWDAVGIYRSNEAEADALRAKWIDAEGTLDLRRCDLTDEVAMEALLAELGPDYCPDAFAHLASAAFDVQPIARFGWKDFAAQIDGSLKSLVVLGNPIAKRMSRRRSGRIICALSSVVIGTPPRGFSSYAVGKYAMVGLLKSLAAEYASKGVAVNAVAPGPMNTALLSGLPELLTEQMRTSIPGERWIDTESVGNAVWWLAAEAGPEI
ncbi:MAG TPA: SDR family oxidoreductase, partial [Rhodothermales bacterium]